MEKYLSLPLTEKDVRELNAGDIVYLTGEIVQLLSLAHRRALEYKAQGKPIPFDVENKAIYHCYACLVEEGSELKCEFIGASTSAVVNPYEPAFIREFKIRAVVGKGGMDEATLNAMKEVGCVYLAQIGGCSQLCSQTLTETTEIFWNDLGTNRGIKHIFDKLGPLIVGMDAKGNSIYAEVNSEVAKNKSRIYEKIQNSN